MLAGEKNLNLARIGFSQSHDDTGYISGSDRDTVGLPTRAPLPDANVSQSKRFGSSHPGGLNIVLCDASVRFIPYNVDQEVFMRMGHRADGVVFELP